jgi:biotin-(acetyl-CoA carboxylase) ligase
VSGKYTRIHLKEIDSTLDEAARRVRDAEDDGVFSLVITADAQTAGRGRSGKSFATLRGDSVYMSVIRRLPEFARKGDMAGRETAAVGQEHNGDGSFCVAAAKEDTGEDKGDGSFCLANSERQKEPSPLSSSLPPVKLFEFAGLTTMAAAVAVCRALGKVLPSEDTRKLGIKWVNDILFEGLKVCGILVEVVDSAVVIGVGVNINVPAEEIQKRHPEVRNIAGSVYMAQSTVKVFPDLLAFEIIDAYERVVAEVCGGDRGDGFFCIAEFARQKKPSPLSPSRQTGSSHFCHSGAPLLSIVEEYKSLEVTVGRNIAITRPGATEPFLAKALGITNSGGLVIACADGRQEILVAGEVSIKH